MLFLRWYAAVTVDSYGRGWVKQHSHVFAVCCVLFSRLVVVFSVSVVFNKHRFSISGNKEVKEECLKLRPPPPTTPPDVAQYCSFYNTHTDPSELRRPVPGRSKVGAPECSLCAPEHLNLCTQHAHLLCTSSLLQPFAARKCPLLAVRSGVKSRG